MENLIVLENDKINEYKVSIDEIARLNYLESLKEMYSTTTTKELDNYPISNGKIIPNIKADEILRYSYTESNIRKRNNRKYVKVSFTIKTYPILYKKLKVKNINKVLESLNRNIYNREGMVLFTSLTDKEKLNDLIFSIKKEHIKNFFSLYEFELVKTISIDEINRYLEKETYKNKIKEYKIYIEKAKNSKKAIDLYGINLNTLKENKVK